MNKKIIAVIILLVLLLGTVTVAFQFICPLTVTECFYTLDTVRRDELESIGVQVEGDADNYLKMRLSFTVLNITVLQPQWHVTEAVAAEEYEGRVIQGGTEMTYEDIDRFSVRTYSLQIIINVNGLSDDETVSLAEGITLRAKDASGNVLIEFAVWDKIK